MDNQNLGKPRTNQPSDHSHPQSLSDIEIRVKALETLLVAKGYVDSESLDLLIDTYENKIGPINGARVVAKAWKDAVFKAWLLKDATAAIASLGFSGRQGEHMVVVENTRAVHNLVVCTLCSCYPWPVLGIPPVWYKSPAYRAKAIVDPKGVLAEFGCELPPETSIRVWDSTAEIRYLVLPLPPADVAVQSEESLQLQVSRDSMIGTGLVKQPKPDMEANR